MQGYSASEWTSVLLDDVTMAEPLCLSVRNMDAWTIDVETCSSQQSERPVLLVDDANLAGIASHVSVVATSNMLLK